MIWTSDLAFHRTVAQICGMQLCALRSQPGTLRVVLDTSKLGDAGGIIPPFSGQTIRGINHHVLYLLTGS